MDIILPMDNAINVIPIVYLANVITMVESAKVDVKTAGQAADAMMRVLQLVLRVNDIVLPDATLVHSTITVRHVKVNAVQTVPHKMAPDNAIYKMGIAILDVLMVGLDQNVRTFVIRIAYRVMHRTKRYAILVVPDFMDNRVKMNVAQTV